MMTRLALALAVTLLALPQAALGARDEAPGQMKKSAPAPPGAKGGKAKAAPKRAAGRGRAKGGTKRRAARPAGPAPSVRARRAGAPAAAPPPAFAAAPPAARSTTRSRRARAAAARRRAEARRRARARLRDRRRARVATPRRVGVSAAAPVAAVPATTAPATGEAATRPARRERAERSEDDGPRAFGVPLPALEPDIPDSFGELVLSLAAIALLALLGFGLAALRAHRLEHRSRRLSDELGLLEAALLPAPAGALGGIAASLAHRAADGPGAGGDFYDAFVLPDGRACVLVGDVSGHGAPALTDTARVRYTLRAYLEAGLEPRAAVELAGKVLEPQVGDLATVIAAVHDPAAGSLTYASAGHPPPIVIGPGAEEAVTVLSSPPLGVGQRTGLRQTTLPLPPGTLACFYTDGLAESRVGGTLLGRDGLIELLESLGPEAGAGDLLKAVSAKADETPDDMAACVLKAHAPAGGGGRAVRVEEIEMDAHDIERGAAERFVAECGLDPVRAGAVLESARRLAGEHGSAVLRLVDGTVLVEPPLRAERLLAAAAR